MITNFTKKVETLLGKKRMAYVASIIQSEDMLEVNLKYPYMHTYYDEVGWLYGTDYEDTQETVFSDLKDWFDLPLIHKVSDEKMRSIGVSK
jgi:hypothetical protein